MVTVSANTMPLALLIYYLCAKFLAAAGDDEKVYTIIKFSRKFAASKDTKDLKIGNGLQNVIWSYSDDDPSSVADAFYHGYFQRGSQQINLKDPSRRQRRLTEASRGRRLWAYFDSSPYEYSVTLKESAYLMFWNITDTHINIALQVQAAGYIGWGISPDGMMANSDVILGWVDGSGEAHVYDSYAPGHYVNDDESDGGSDGLLSTSAEEVSVSQVNTAEETTQKPLQASSSPSALPTFSPTFASLLIDAPKSSSTNSPQFLKHTTTPTLAELSLPTQQYDVVTTPMQHEAEKEKITVSPVSSLSTPPPQTDHQATLSFGISTAFPIEEHENGSPTTTSDPSLSRSYGPSAAISGCVKDIQGFTHSVQLSEDYTFHWAVQDSYLVAKAEVTLSSFVFGTPWVAWGVNKEMVMAGAVAAVGLPLLDEVALYDLTGYTEGEVRLREGEDGSGLVNATITHEEDSMSEKRKVVMLFSWELEVLMEHSSGLSRQLGVIWAHGYASELGYHCCRGTTVLDLLDPCFYDTSDTTFHEALNTDQKEETISSSTSAVSAGGSDGEEKEEEQEGEESSKPATEEPGSSRVTNAETYHSVTDTISNSFESSGVFAGGAAEYDSISSTGDNDGEKGNGDDRTPSAEETNSNFMCATDDDGFTHVEALSDIFTLRWMISDDYVFHAKAVVATACWVSVGFSTLGSSMIGSHAVVGFPTSERVKEYDLGGYSMSTITPKADHPALLTGSILQKEGATTMHFTRDLKVGPTANYVGSSLHMLWANGHSNTFGYHAARGSKKIILAPCSDDTSFEDSTTEGASSSDSSEDEIHDSDSASVLISLPLMALGLPVRIASLFLCTFCMVRKITDIIC